MIPARLSLAALVLGLGLAPFQQAAALDCEQATNQGDLNVCAERAFKEADGQLNKTWRELIGSFQADDRKEAITRAREAQRAWIAFREKECGFLTGGSIGGSAHGMMVSACRTRLTAARVDDLKGALECLPEDHGSCP